jgi:DNA (cytosine-5)-methyltransferase 1
MQVISLFSGIGGFDLAAHWLGWRTVAMCEIDAHCRTRLRKHWPDTYIHKDIHTLDYDTLIQHSSWNPSEPTILVGGWPCQPFSVAGKQRGTADDRYFWPQVARLLDELRPRHFLGENVPGFLNLGLDQTLSDLEARAYAWAACDIPAVAVGADHLRHRIWIYGAADPTGWRRGTGRDSNSPQRAQSGGEAQPDSSIGPAAHAIEQPTGRQQRRGLQPHTGGSAEADTHPNGAGWGQQHTSAFTAGQGQCGGLAHAAATYPTWWAAESKFCGVPDGLSSGLDKGRRQRLKQLGNAIVPQVAYELLRYVQAVDALHYPNSQS